MLGQLSFLATLALVSAVSVHYRDCGSQKGAIKSVDVTPCKGAPDMCYLKKGTSPKISVTFTPNGKIAAVKAKVTGIVEGLPVPFPLANPDGCTNSGLSCPLSAGAAVTYSQNIEIKSAYPSIPVGVRWKLVDGSGNNIVCFLLHVKITSASKFLSAVLPRENMPDL